MHTGTESSPATQDVCLTRRHALAVLGAGLALGTIALAGGCSRVNTDPQDVDPLEVWEPPYDWDALMTNPRGRKFYFPEGRLSSKLGVDVSDHDGEIDWAAAAADGVEFAFVRVGYRGYTEGGIYPDEYYKANLEGARANFIPVGAYFFSSAINEAEAVEEATYLLELLDGYVLEYPIVFDQEQVADARGRANNLTPAQYTANARAFCETVTAAGYQAMIYGNQHHLAKLDLDALSAYPLWYAEFGVSAPTGHFNFTIWQYTDTGSVAGFSKGCDVNIQFLPEPVAVPTE